MDSFSLPPAIGRPERTNLASDSCGPFEAIDLAQLRFVRHLIRIGLTVDEAGAVVANEIERLRTAKKQPRRVLVGMRLVPVTA